MHNNMMSANVTKDKHFKDHSNGNAVVSPHSFRKEPEFIYLLKVALDTTWILILQKFSQMVGTNILVKMLPRNYFPVVALIVIYC